MLTIVLLLIGVGIYSLVSAAIVTQDDVEWLDDHPIMIIFLQLGFFMFCFVALAAASLICFLEILFSDELNWFQDKPCQE